MPDYQTILYETSNGVATVTLNRPERRNAFTNEMLKELTHALKQIQKDGSVRAVVLAGAGKGFCAGQIGRAHV